MKILQSSDWHLGRIFHGHHLTSEQGKILEKIEEIIIEQKPDVYVVVGDIYDRGVPPVEAVELLGKHLLRVTRDLKTKTIIISGNHDSAERLGFASALLRSGGLYIYTGLNLDFEPLVIEDKNGPVMFYPLPYAGLDSLKIALQDNQLESCNEGWKRIVSMIEERHPVDKRAVCLTHAFVHGGATSDSERPLFIGGGEEVNASVFDMFNYTALGHLHKMQTINGKLHYSGSLMKYSLSEANDDKGCSLIELDDDGKVNIEFIKLVPEKDLRIISGYFEDLMQKSSSDYIAVQLLDEKPLFEVVSRLRVNYPDLVHLERLAPLSNLHTEQKKSDINRNEFELFNDFFSYINDAPLGVTDEQYARDVISRVMGRSE